MRSGGEVYSTTSRVCSVASSFRCSSYHLCTQFQQSQNFNKFLRRRALCILSGSAVRPPRASSMRPPTQELSGSDPCSLHGWVSTPWQRLKVELRRCPGLLAWRESASQQRRAPAAWLASRRRLHVRLCGIGVLPCGYQGGKRQRQCRAVSLSVERRCR